MIIKINKRLKFFPTMRLHGQQAVADQVMRLHHEGWQQPTDTLGQSATPSIWYS